MGLAGVDLGDESPAGESSPNRPIGHQHVLASVVGRPLVAEFSSARCRKRRQTAGKHFRQRGWPGRSPRVGVINWIASPFLTPTKTSPLSSRPVGSISIEAIGLKSTSTMMVPRSLCSASRTTAESGNPNTPSTRRGGTPQPPSGFSVDRFAPENAAIRFAGPLEAITRPCSSSIQTAMYSVMVASAFASNRSASRRNCAGLIGSSVLRKSNSRIRRAARKVDHPLLMLFKRGRQHLLPQRGNRHEPFENLILKNRASSPGR